MMTVQYDGYTWTKKEIEDNYNTRHEKYYPTHEERQRQAEQKVIDELLDASAVNRLVHRHFGVDGLRQWWYTSQRDRERAMRDVEEAEAEAEYAADVQQMERELRNG